MNRVLNVLIVLGLACSLACAPGSRHQSGSPAANKGAKPGPAPSSSPSQGQDLNVTKAAAPIVVNKSFDPTSATLTAANAFPNMPEKGLTLIFSTKDSKKQIQEAKIVVDENSDITNADSTLSATYGCEDADPNKTPSTCSDAVIKFTWNRLSGQAEVKINNGGGKGLDVTEAIDKVPATKQLWKAAVLNLNFTLNSVPFNRTTAAIQPVAITPEQAAKTTYDDKQSGSGSEANTTILVYGLPKVGLDGTTAIRPTETLSATDNDAPRVPSGISMTAENQLIYTLGIQSASNAVQQLTMTISIPSTDGDKADSTPIDDKAAAAAKPKSDGDASTAIAPKSGASTSTGSASGSENGAAPTTETDKLASAGTGTAGTPDASKPKPVTKVPDQAKTDQPKANAKPDTQAKPDAAAQAQKSIVAPIVQVPAQTVTGVTKSCDYDSAKAIKLPSAGYEYVNQKVEFVNGQPNINLDNRMAYLGWRNNYCDSSTGRIAVLAEAPGAVPCLAKAVPNDHNETIIFTPTDGTSSGLCGGRMTHYVPGVYDTVDSKRACEVKALDGMKMQAAEDAGSDGHKAHIWSPGIVYGQNRYAMNEMSQNPGQYQYGINDGTDDYTFHDIFNQSNGSTDQWQCWGRVSKRFSSQK